MRIEERLPDEALEMTNDELAEADIGGLDYDEDITVEDEYRDEVGDIRTAFEVYAGAILINRMFDDGYLTFGEYLDLIDHVEDYERDLDVVLM